MKDFQQNLKTNFLFTVTELNSEKDIEDFIREVNNISNANLDFNFEDLKNKIYSETDFTVDMNRYQFQF